MRRSVSAIARARAMTTCGALVHGHVDHLAVEVDGRRAPAHAVLERLDDPPRVLHLGGIRREHAVQHGHLVGMDAAGALAAELARALGGPLEGGEVAKSRDAADEAGGLHADGLADRHQTGDRVEQLEAVGRGLDAQLQAVVLDADAHRGDAVARARDLLDGQEAARRLEREGEAQVPGRQPARALQRVDPRDDRADLRGGLRLGDRQAVEAGMHGGVDVVGEQGGIVVHAHQHLGAAPAGERRARRARACGRSPSPGRDGVLEVEDDGVGAARVRLLDEARDVDGQDQRRAAGAGVAMVR